MTLQLEIGTEVLAIMVIMGAIGVVLSSSTPPGATRHPPEPGQAALVGLGAGVSKAVVLLAIPTWIALAGPAHFSGGLSAPMASTTSCGQAHLAQALRRTLADLEHTPSAPSRPLVRGGNQGPVLSLQTSAPACSPW